MEEINRTISPNDRMYRINPRAILTGANTR